MAPIITDTQTHQHTLTVAWFHSNFPMGGAETVTLTIARSLTQNHRQFRPIIITSNLTTDVEGVEIHTIDKGLTPSTPEGRRAIINKLRELHADIYIQPQDSAKGWLTDLRHKMP